MTPKERNLADIGLIALRHGLTRFDILGPCKTRKVVDARQDCVAMFSSRGLSSPLIGRIMGRDHSTILHALKKHRARILCTPYAPPIYDVTLPANTNCA